jgi:aspartate carbamoyltransferase catalytic subunit
MRNPQLNADGALTHLLTLEGLPADVIRNILDTADPFVSIGEREVKKVPLLRGKAVFNLFFENSTRTRVSFELAAKRLGADVVNLEVQLSSRVKGESMLDTIYTLEACHVDVFVIRDAEAGVPGLVASHAKPHVSVLSAGEGSVSHPTQGLLDALTILQAKKKFHGLKVAIVGDVKHSRVARSALHVLATLEVGELRIVAPRALMPEPGEFAGCERFTAIDAGISGVDVVMMLRIQKERMATAQVPDADRYFAKYGLSAERLAKASPDAIVMHPQPMNRGIEIASDVADGPQSVIRDQVRNGVAVRMAVLEAVVEGRGK